MSKSSIRRAGATACMFSLLSVGSAVGQGMPLLPQNPKSPVECSDWGRAYESWWDIFLAKVRRNDEVCKSQYTGKYTSINSLCGNTITGPITHQNPCDETTLYVQCEWIGFFHQMGACLATLSDRAKVSGPIETKLEPDDVAFVKKLAKQDEFIKELSTSAAGAAALAKVLDFAATGPVKLAIQWDQTLIDGWRQANKTLDVLNKHQICDEIIEHSLSTTAIRYFDGLYKARGCDQY